MSGVGQGPAEVGNEFGGSMEEALAAETAPAPEAAPAAADSEEAPSTWADPDPNAETEAPEAAAAAGQKPAPGAAPATLEIKTKSGVRKFALDPNSDELKRELALAQGARTWQRERDEARKALTELQAKAAKASQAEEVWNELKSLTQAGQTERVVRAVLGDSYDQFKKQLLEEERLYENGSPDDRMTIERNRIQREREFERLQADKRTTAAEAKLRETEDRIETDRLRSLGTAAMTRHDFRGVVDDADQANALNTKLWKLAWADLEDAAETGQQIDATAIQRAFAQNFKVLSAGRSKAAAKQVDKIIETKKQEAVKTAQVAATERYPTTKPDVSGWDGRRAKDLLKMLVKGK